MRRAALAAALAALVAACAAPPPRPQGVDPALMAEVAKATERKPQPRPEAVEQALLPPLRMELPAAAGRPLDPRFDLSVTNAPAQQVFMAIVAGTRYSMLLHPEVSGTISVNLKDVTVHEALDSIRELYGYEYRIEGTRVFVQPAGLQTRVFQVNYLPGQRFGRTDIRVVSGPQPQVAGTAGAVAGAAGVPTGVPTATAGVAAGGAGPLGAAGVVAPGQITSMTTEQHSAFWSDLCEALVAIAFPPDTQPQPQPPGGQALGQSRLNVDQQRGICNRRHAASDRSIVVSPQSGVIVVRALPRELRAIEQYLRATRLAVERQVMLEAKIIEVTLSDAYQAGINWAAFRNSGPNIAVGQLSSSGAPVTATTLGTRGQALVSAGVSADTAGRSLTATSAALGIASGNPAGAVFGLALQTSNFAALLAFLESQGSVQVLSSPRIATLNNQKAVLKVGTDELLVSNVAVSPATATVAGVTEPTIAPQFSPYFSGIVLDVTPQIDESGNITLHIRPSVSEVTEVTRELVLGRGANNSFAIPTARSSVSESDTIVRVADGNIVAIGGLMRVDVRDNRGGIPGVTEGGFGNLVRNTNRQLVKKELVILLKPTIIQSDRNWEQDLRETRGRFEALGAPPAAAQPAAPAR